MQNIQEKIINSKLKPYFADEVLISASIKARENQKTKELKKEGFVRLLFINATNQEPITEIVISSLTAENLQMALAQR